MMHIGFNHKGVTTGTKRLGGSTRFSLFRLKLAWPIFWDVFFYQFMSSLDYQLIDLIQNLRCEKTQVVLDRLQVVCRFVLPTPMLEHPANGVVMAGQLMNSIIIGVEAQTQRAENQDLPLFHPGTPKTAVRFLMSLLVGKSRTLPGRNEPCQNLEYGFA